MIFFIAAVSVYWDEFMRRLLASALTGRCAGLMSTPGFKPAEKGAFEASSCTRHHEHEQMTFSFLFFSFFFFAGFFFFFFFLSLPFVNWSNGAGLIAEHRDLRWRPAESPRQSDPFKRQNAESSLSMCSLLLSAGKDIGEKF